jgi:hypothetical protein
MIGSSLGTARVSAHLLLSVNILRHKSRCSVVALYGCEQLSLRRAAAPSRPYRRRLLRRRAMHARL